ncbi:MAG: PaaI family thioesterase [Deltaproteobacteria bacterium]|nr:PaaI family thioesterase [Deltaproteobacteria bacterium]MBW1993942.1 PaaI family thioesterase [Deltaproteobacteria bacterium]MBW2151283.1 PaaI family thioesterase [Deltaproteobacteria bacterium]
MPLSPSRFINDYDLTLKKLKEAHHSECFFQRNSPVGNLRFSFSKDGTLMGEFICSTEHQGYQGIVHGGIISAVIDASMVQCCMGHGFITYTTDLSIRYRRPVMINTPCVLQTRIVSIARRVLFLLETRIMQNGQVHVEANGRFFKAKYPC